NGPFQRRADAHPWEHLYLVLALLCRGDLVHDDGLGRQASGAGAPLRRVMREAAQWAAAHPREAKTTVATNLKENPQEAAAAAPVAYGGALTPPLIQPVIDMAAKYGLIKARFPAQDLLSN